MTQPELKQWKQKQRSGIQARFLPQVAFPQIYTRNKSTNVKARFHKRFLMRFRLESAPCPTLRECFFAKHRVDWKGSHHILFKDTFLSNLCQLGDILSQSHTTKKPVRGRLGHGRFCTQNRIKNRMRKRALCCLTRKYRVRVLLAPHIWKFGSAKVAL